MVRPRHLAVGRCCWAERSVASVENDADIMVTSDLGGVLALAVKGGADANAFGQFCQKHLCMESWEFIIDVVRYETTVSVSYS